MLTLYEVLGSNSPESRHALFCPTAVKTRFALINKGIEFQTKFVTYHDLRFIWKQKLGVEKATSKFWINELVSLKLDYWSLNFFFGF